MITLIGRPLQIDLQTTIPSSASIMPVYNNIVYTVSSDNVLECKFRYICDIYVNGVLITREKLFPNLSGNADFKINRVLEDFVINNPQINVVGFVTDPNRILQYELKFGEEYDTSTNCDQSSVIYPDLLSSGIDYAWNGSMQYEEFYDYINGNTLTDFIMDSVNYGRFLTNQPERILIGIGEQAELSFLNLPDLSRNAARLVIDTYDVNGNQLDQNDIVNLSATVSNYQQMFNTVGVGVENINNALGYNFINSMTDYYNVYLINEPSTSNLIENPTFQYNAGDTKWTIDSHIGCASSLQISVVNKMQLVIPDVSCADTFQSYYIPNTFQQGKTYDITFTIDSINNPSGNACWVRLNLGGNYTPTYSSVGTHTIQFSFAYSNVLFIEMYMDADTGGFGSHSMSMTDISFIEVGGNRTSEIKTYQIDKRKSKYNPVRFRWLNSLGGFDSYTYNLVSKENINISKTEYDKLMGSYNDDLGYWTYQIGDRGRTTTSVNAKSQFNATSNWLTEDENRWMEELYSNPNTYLQSVNKLYPYYKTFAANLSNPDENPNFYLNYPLSQLDKDNISNTQIFIDKNDYSYNSDMPQGLTSSVGTYSFNNIYVTDTLGSNIQDDCGVIYKYNAELRQYPIIVTNTSYDIKEKKTTKNINQTISFEYAFDKNRQRN